MEKLMLRWRGPVLGLVAMCWMASAYASSPSDTESDAFIRIYSFSVLKALAIENLALKVEAGQISKVQADCALVKIDFEELLPRARSVVATSFRSGQTLNEATAFFSSPTGVKMSEFGASSLREFLRAKAHGKTPPPLAALPPTYTAEDILVAAKFDSSVAGADFSRFVKDGLPKMSKVNLLQPALEACRAAK